VGVETCFRIASWDTPLRANPNRAAARYNDAGSPATQYLSLHPLGHWAEYLRTHGLRDAVQVADRRLRIWAVKVDLSRAVEIGYAEAASFGIEASDLVSDDHHRCRELAAKLRQGAGSPATIIVPSAALPGTRNVVIFGERVQIPYDWPPKSSIDLPACVVAERSQPPDGLERFVRHRGDEHLELEAWNEGRTYRFPDLLPLPPPPS